MTWLSKLFSRRRRYSDLSVSIQGHLEEKIDELMEEGLSRQEASQIARREFGNVTLIEEQSRESWQWRTLESTWADVRYALRQLVKSPGFAVTVILTMALGIGANTAIFTLVNNILMKSLPVGEPRALFRIGDKSEPSGLTNGLEKPDGDFDIFSYNLYRHFRESTPEFEQLAAMQAGPNRISVRRGDESTRTMAAELVSGNYFSTLGVGAFAGRTFTNADDGLGAAPVAVMNYQAWQANYAGDPSVIGATFYLQGQPVTVIGIAAAGFYGDRASMDPPVFWIPLSVEPLLRPGNSMLPHSDVCWLYALGRLKPGVSLMALQEKISANLRQWIVIQQDYTKYGIGPKLAKLHVVLTPGGGGIQDLQQQTGKELYLLLGITGFVLLVACANVANLLLARGTKRRAEISMRMALGAARARLIRQMLTESVLLGCLGGLTGLGIAYAGARTILALAFPNAVDVVVHATPSLAVFGFAFLLSLVTGMVFGIVPAWITSHANPAEALRGTEKSSMERGTLPQKSLIVFQAAISLALLAGASLFTRSLNNLEHQNFGLETTNRYVMHLNPAQAGYKPEELDQLQLTLEQQIESIPGMKSVGIGLFSPLDGNPWGFTVFFPGEPVKGYANAKVALINRVTPGFFAAVGQPVIRGRGFNQSDNGTSSHVVLVNQAFVRKFFAGQEPIGRHFGSWAAEDIGAYEVVGVVADAKYSSPRLDPRPMFFRPLAQWQHNLNDPTEVGIEAESHYFTAIVMHYAGTPQSLDATLHRVLQKTNPNLAMTSLHTLDDQLAGNFSQERMIARLTALFGVLALLLAAVGLYGITSYQVTQRTREIGLRMALGADRSRVLAMVMRGAFVQVALGLVLGIPLVLIGAHYLEHQLFEVKSYDPLSLLLAGGFLMGAAVVASFIPARRATSIDPMRAVRCE